MAKNIIIFTLSVVVLAGGLWMAIERKTTIMSGRTDALEGVAGNSQGEKSKAAPLVVKTAEEIQEEEWKKIWLEKYQIGASHPNNYDPLTFNPVDEFFAKDKNNAYFVRIISENTSSSFKTTYQIYAIPGADTATFSSMGYPYSKDKRSVYYYEKRLFTEAASFQNLSMLYTKDGNSAYFENVKILSSDPATFVFLDGYYAKDRNSVYYQGKKILGADVDSFVTANAREAYDSNYNYYDGRIKDRRK